MSYQSFLMAMSQLAHGRQAILVAEGHRICLSEGTGKNQWVFSTSVFQTDEELPQALQEALSPRGRFCYDSEGPQLHFDKEEGRVDLLYRVEMEKGKFLPFRAHLSAFLRAAHEWRAILRDFEERESAPLFSRRRSFSLFTLGASLFAWMRSAVDVLAESVF